jgi:hypothetical protein
MAEGTCNWQAGRFDCFAILWLTGAHGGCRMKRRTFQRLRPAQQPEHHHNVYVVLLDPAVGRVRKVRAANQKRDPKKPCVYVGMTGLTPEERFANHKAAPKPRGS